MELLENTKVDKVIEQSFDKSMTYNEYRDLVKHLAETKSTSGNEKTEARINFTMLNDRRMKRWDKTIKASETVHKNVSKIKDKITWLVITESWCGDAAHVLPAINKLAELNGNINLRIVLRDEHEELMDNFLTNGSRSIPKLIAVDNSSEEIISTYGPRPSEVTQMVNNFKSEYGMLTPEFKESLQHWYNKDKGQNVMHDMVQLFTD